MPAPPADVAFLVDVDNTLLDNGAVVASLRRHFRETVGAEGEQRYWQMQRDHIAGASNKDA